MLRRWLWACAFVATVLVAALSHDAVVWAQGYGGVGFPRGGGPARGLLDALYCQLASPCVLTGNNSGGTGTLRIRPSDEDTQLVICEASNNSSPEVCSSWQHYNSSVTSSASFYATNLYVDSAGATQVYASAFGSGYFQTAGTTAAGVTYFGVRHPAAAANTANYVLECRSTGATTATCTWGSGHTTTMDTRGPELNGGAAACGTSSVTGGKCITDDSLMLTDANALFYARTTGTTGTAATVYGPTTFASQLQLGWYGSSADADYASSPAILAIGGSALIIGNGSDITAGNPSVIFKDNTGGTGVTLADIDGAGRIRPLVYGSQSNCSDGAGAAACSAAPAGSVVIDDGSTTVVVSTTAVTANSQILVTFDSSLGTKLGVTCNTTYVDPYVTARTAATSFTITAADPAGANPACFSYFIVN